MAEPTGYGPCRSPGWGSDHRPISAPRWWGRCWTAFAWIGKWTGISILVLMCGVVVLTLVAHVFVGRWGGTCWLPEWWPH